MAYLMANGPDSISDLIEIQASVPDQLLIGCGGDADDGIVMIGSSHVGEYR